jgi:hypothetical protein
MADRQRFLHFFARLAVAQLALHAATIWPHAAAHCFPFAGCEQHATSEKPTAASVHGTWPSAHCGPCARQRPLALSHSGAVVGQQAPLPQSVPHRPQPGWPTGQHSTCGDGQGGGVVVVVVELVIVVDVVVVVVGEATRS